MVMQQASVGFAVVAAAAAAVVVVALHEVS